MIFLEKIHKITSPLSASGKNVNFTIELSELELADEVCPACAGKIKLLESQRDQEGKITHYFAECIKCGMKGEVMNSVFCTALLFPLDYWRVALKSTQIFL